MPRLAELQQEFLAYLLGRESGFIERVVDDDRVGAPARAGIYRNGYRQRLRDTLDIDHEILGRYLGDELFEQMVDGYLARHPSRHTSLRHFADQLPAFLGDTAPFSAHPVLAELAAFERTLLSVFDAPDGERVAPAILAALPAPRWPGMRLRLHPSVRLFTARWNAVPVWQALKAEKTPPAAAAGEPRSWLLWRNGERVTEFRPLAEPERWMLDGALAGRPFAELCAGLLAWHDAEDAGREALVLLQGWLVQGLVAELLPG